MTDPPGTPNDLFMNRATQAVAELAKGMKSVSFYPEGHPSLVQAVTKIARMFEEIPLPERGLEISVTRNALSIGDTPLPAAGKAADLHRELYLRRAARIIFLPGVRPDEFVAFLRTVTRDIEEIQDAGGLERVLLREKVLRIWANRVDYEQLTELLKKEEELEEVEPEALPETIADSTDGPDPAATPPPGDAAVELLLGRIEAETDASAYRGHVVEFTKLLSAEPAERKFGYAGRAIAIFVRHIGQPPGGCREIPGIARLGIKELASDELIARFIGQLRTRDGQGRREVESILAAMEERPVAHLLHVLAEEKDLLVRKAIVEIVSRIGRAAVPPVLENLGDSRWYMVRNLVVILGNLGMSDLAPHVVATLSHPDLRVKKEAIKALSRIPHPAAVDALCELCFFPEESVALTATAALAQKREPEAVAALFRRICAKRFLYPNYRLAHEAIDSLRAIGTEDAAAALERVLALSAPWRTEKFRAMKSHALRSISRIPGARSREIVERVRGGGDQPLRIEAERILHRRDL